MNYIYSKAAAKRIFDKTKTVNTVNVDRDRVRAIFSDGTTESTSTAEFKRHFAEYRQEQGKKLSPMLSPEDDSIWYVSRYKVVVYSDYLSCNCRDWKAQSAIGISRPCCKHVYSVLYQMGYGKLSEYLAERNSKKPKYILCWESYGRDRAGNPLETAVNEVNRKPTTKEINQYRKDYHCIGYKLVDIKKLN